MYKGIRRFVELEVLGGILLFIAALGGIIVSNTHMYDFYIELVNLPVDIGIGEYSLNKPLIKWVNDGLMSVFFLMLGLEIKFHTTEGEFQSFDKILLAFGAAIGGVIFPASFFMLFNYGNPDTMHAWAIPVAFDSAFVLAILAFFPKQISIQAKIFVIGIALVDDVFAISILAIFYTGSVQLVPFLLAIIFGLSLVVINRFKVKQLWVYLLLGLLLWIATVESGIHGTIAGIILALTIPTRIDNVTLVQDLEKKVHPIVTYLILPIFAFLNSEVPFSQVGAEDFNNSLTLGIMSGLVLGKPIGIFLFSFILIHFRYASLPKSINWIILVAISVLNGIGFTLSLFIGSIAFDSEPFITRMRMSIILSSMISAMIGITILACEKRLQRFLSKRL